MTARAIFPRRRPVWRRFTETALATCVIAALLGLWEFLPRAGLFNPLFSSYPSQIARTAIELARSGDLLKDIVASGKTFFAGFALSVIVGTPLGVLLGWFRLANRAFSPLVTALYTTPRVALMPLFIIWFGLGMGSKVTLVFLSGVFYLIVNMQVAMTTIDEDLRRVGVAYGANNWQIFRTIALPLSIPFLLTGTRLAMGRCLLGMVAAEVFGGAEGLGYLIQYAGATFRTDMVFVGVFIIAAFGIAMDRGLYFLNRRIEAWRGLDL